MADVGYTTSNCG